MKISRLAGVTALLAAGFAQAQTPSIKLDGVLFEFWQTQMLDNSLRTNPTAAAGASKYYGLDSRFQENTFAVKRAEFYLGGTVTDQISWAAMFDPNNAANVVGNNILQDLTINWTPVKGFSLKAGQFKMPTVYESTLVGAREILFFDRNQIARTFGERRDRGIWASYGYGDAKGFQGKLNVAISNGTTDDGSAGKNNDGNAQKDYMFRFEGAYSSAHKFGFYYREGVMSLKDTGLNAPTTQTSTSTSTFNPGPPSSVTTVTTTTPVTFYTPWAAGATAQQVKDNKDKTTLEGLYYSFKNDRFQFSAEYATGLLGRRFPTLFASAAAAPAAPAAPATPTALNPVTTSTSTSNLAPLREHLDQKFAGFAVDGAYKMGAHWLTARYDTMNYNSGDNWYTATSPYKNAVTGADFSPKYTETTVGYNYVFIPSKQSAGKLKLNYIMRSKNFLSPVAAYGQTTQQGGNSLVASVMVSY